MEAWEGKNFQADTVWTKPWGKGKLWIQGNKQDSRVAKAKGGKEKSNWRWGQRSSQGGEFGFYSEYTGKTHSDMQNKWVDG